MKEMSFEQYCEENGILRDLRYDLSRAKDDYEDDYGRTTLVELENIRKECVEQKRVVKKMEFELILAERRLELAPIYEEHWQQQLADKAHAALAALFKFDEE